MLTYQLPDSIRQIAMQGEFDGFDLNIFFSAEGEGRKARFKYEDESTKISFDSLNITSAQTDSIKITTSCE